MTLRRKAVQGVAWNAIGEWSRVAVAFLVFAALAHLLEPRAFGLLALAMVFVSVARVLTEGGLADAIVQRADLDDDHLDTVFWTLLLASLALAGVTWLAAPAAGRVLGEPLLPEVLRWLAPLFVLHALVATQEAVLKRDLEFRALAVRSLAGVLVGGVVGLWLAFRGYGVWSLVGQQLAIGGTDALVLWGASSWRPGVDASRARLRELATVGLPLVGTSLLDLARRRADDLIIGALLGTTLLGYYVVAYRVLEALTDLLTGVASKVAFPTFSRLQEDPRDLREGYVQAVRYTSLVAFPAFLGATVVAPHLVPGFYGAQWLPSVPVLQVLLLAGLTHAVLFNRSVLLAGNRPNWVLLVNLLEAGLLVAAFVAAAPYGLVAVAAAFVGVRYLLVPVSLHLVDRLVDLDAATLARAVLGPLAASVGMAAFVHLLDRGLAMGPLPSLAVLVPLGVAAYALLLRLAFPTLFREGLDLLRNLAPQRGEAA